MAISGKEWGVRGGGALQEPSLYRDIDKKAWQCKLWSNESCSKNEHVVYVRYTMYMYKLNVTSSNITIT